MALSSTQFNTERNATSPQYAGTWAWWALGETDFSGGSAASGSGSIPMTLRTTHSTDYVYDSAEPTLSGGASVVMPKVAGPFGGAFSRLIG